MKSNFSLGTKQLCVIAVSGLFLAAFVVVSCDSSGGEDGSSWGGGILTITDITGHNNEWVTVEILTNWGAPGSHVALEWGLKKYQNTTGSLSVELAYRGVDPWTGTGSYYIVLYFTVDHVHYRVVETYSKVSFVSGNATVAFSNFH
jgi:hypothetical protein